LNRSPILRALSSMRKSGARTLLMGGQACEFYGAAEFSRDLDLLILSDPGNLGRLRAALADLEAEPIAVPPLDEASLAKGHAAHFRCRGADVAGLRIDLMSRYRGGPEFEDLWRRRTTIEVHGEPIDLLALGDLVNAKKTQRDKDWPMIGRLMERSYFEREEKPSREQIEFWLRELRTPELLVELAEAHPDIAHRMESARQAVAAALTREPEGVALALEAEEREERLKDREFWRPLKLELEQLRRERRSDRQT
jgi:hypothetical protein